MITDISPTQTAATTPSRSAKGQDGGAGPGVVKATMARQAGMEDAGLAMPTSEATPRGFLDPAVLQTAQLLATQAEAEVLELNRATSSERAASALQAMSDELLTASGPAHGHAFNEIRAFLNIAVRTLRSDEAECA